MSCLHTLLPRALHPYLAHGLAHYLLLMAGIVSVLGLILGLLYYIEWQDATALYAEALPALFLRLLAALVLVSGGQIPGSGGSARLQKMVGITRTKDIVMRSRRISGAQAYDWGVATECVPDNELEAATDALVDELRGFSPLAQRTAKKLLNDTEDSPLSIAIELEGHCYSRLRSSNDFREGVEAFHDKRRARFNGT